MIRPQKFCLMLTDLDDMIFCDNLFSTLEKTIERIKFLEKTSKNLKCFTVVKGSKIHYKKTL